MREERIFARICLMMVLALILASCGGSSGGYTIGGVIIDNSTGLGLVGAAVTLSWSGGSLTKYTEADGSYRFYDLFKGTFTVTPQMAGYTFTPAAQTLGVSSSLSGLDFGGTKAPTDIAAPIFSGIVMAYSPEPGEAVFNWAVATDDESGPSALRYDIYCSTTNDPAVIKTPSNLVASSTGTDSSKVTGLAPGGTYYCMAVSVDEAGNESSGQVVVQITVLSAALTVGSAPEDLSDLDVTVVETSADDFTVTGPDAATLSAGDFVVIDTSSGQTLKKILTVNAVSGGVQILTADASLNEVITSGEIYASATFANALSSSGAGARALSVPYSATYTSPSGAFTYTETDYSDTPPEPSVARLQSAAKSDIDTYDKQTTLYSNGNSSIMLGYTVDFEPSFYMKAIYLPSGLDFVKVEADGTLTLDALLGYYLELASKDTIEKTVFSKTLNLKYSVGPVPVYQDVSLELIAELDYDASADLSVESKLNAVKQISYGFMWDSANLNNGNNGWTTYGGQGFTKEITFDVVSEGKLVATLRIYPRISTILYKAANSSVGLVPALKLDSAATFVPKTELTKFDVGFWVYVHSKASLKILDTSLVDWESTGYDILPYELIYSLPELQLVCPAASIAQGATMQCDLTVTDGANNTVQDSSIAWSVDPPATASVSPSSGAKTTTVTGSAQGNSKLWASAYGDGFLGQAGTRYTSADFAVTASAGGGGGGGGNQPPTAPTSVSATALDYQRIKVAWSGSTDDVSVAGHKVYMDGTFLKDVSAFMGNSTAATGLNSGRTYCFRVAAYDDAGATSSQSSQACATTASAPISNNFVYVDPATGLMWEKGDSGIKWDHIDSLNYCQSLNNQAYNGFSSGWRLPTIEELTAAASDLTFPPVQSDGYWSGSSPSAGNYWYFNYSTDTASIMDGFAGFYYTKCVRTF